MRIGQFSAPQPPFLQMFGSSAQGSGMNSGGGGGGSSAPMFGATFAQNNVTSSSSPSVLGGGDQGSANQHGTTPLAMGAISFSNAALDSYLLNLNMMRHPLDAIIIGSGVGGLTAASFMVQSGLKVLVLERAARCGGSTHGFEENGYKFEMGLQDVGARVWLGMNGDPGSRVLCTASLGQIEWTHVEVASHCIVIGELNFLVRPTWNEFCADLLRLFPNEAAALDRYREVVNHVRALSSHYVLSRMRPRPDMEYVSDALHKLPTNESAMSDQSQSSSIDSTYDEPTPVKEFRAYAAMTVDDALSEITQNRDLKYLLTYIWGKYGLPPHVASWAAHCMVAGSFLDGVAYPRGGAGSIEAAMVNAITRLGGLVFTSCSIDHIVMENDACVGVKMADGRIVRSTKVISAVGAANTFEKLIPASHTHLVLEMQQIISDLSWSSFANLQIFIGFRGSAQELGVDKVGYWFLPPTADHTENTMRYFVDPSFNSPFPYVHVSFPSTKDLSATKTTCVVLAGAHYDWFKNMRKEDVEVVADKIVKRLTAQLFEKFPKLQGKDEFVGFATPLSHEYHLGAKRGAPLGLGHTPQRFQKWMKPQTPIRNLCMAGQDVFVSGVPNASIGGLMGACAAFPDLMVEKWRHLLF